MPFTWFFCVKAIFMDLIPIFGPVFGRVTLIHLLKQKKKCHLRTIFMFSCLLLHLILENEWFLKFFFRSSYVHIYLLRIYLSRICFHRWWEHTYVKEKPMSVSKLANLSGTCLQHKEQFLIRFPYISHAACTRPPGYLDQSSWTTVQRARASPGWRSMFPGRLGTGTS